jgi:hypothetical protein
MDKVAEFKKYIAENALEKRAFNQNIQEGRLYEAWKSVDRSSVTEGEKVALRQKILAKAKQSGINTKGWSQK